MSITASGKTAKEAASAAKKRKRSGPVIISVDNVYKNFRVYYDKGAMLKEQFVNPGRSRYEEREILKGISFKVHKGETVALIGQNGCGKSTTLKMLTKILYPNKGTVTVNGKVSSLIELGAGFHPDMSGRENIYINASILGIKKEEVDKRIDEVIRFSELENFIDNPIRTYSSGMYMRLAFSVAINVNADILLIDEILAVGDQAFQEKCIRKLEELRASGVTVVLVSHSMGQIKKIADRCIWIENGLVREDGDTETVCDHYEEAMTRRREERDELEELQRRTEDNAAEAAISASDTETQEQIKLSKKEEKERKRLEKQKRQEEFSSKWQGGGTQGKPIAAICMIALLMILGVSSDVFRIGIENATDNIMTITQASLLAKIVGYSFFVIGRISIPMILILIGFEVLPGDYSSSEKVLDYYKKTFLPIFMIWEIWVLVYQVFLHIWMGRAYSVSTWIKEAFLIKYVDLNNAWIFRFVMLFLLIAPLVAVVLQAFDVRLLRFLMIIGWVLIFLFPGLDYYGQANGGEASFPQSIGTFCYFFYFCLGYLISRYVQRILKGSREVLFFAVAFVLTVFSQIFLEERGIDYLIKPTYFGVSIMALFGFDLLVRVKVDEMYPRVSDFFKEAYKCVFWMYFVSMPMQMILTRYIFRTAYLQEKSNLVVLTGMMLGLWILTFGLSLIVVWAIRKGINCIRKDR